MVESGFGFLFWFPASAVEDLVNLFLMFDILKTGRHTLADGFLLVVERAVDNSLLRRRRLFFLFVLSPLQVGYEWTVGETQWPISCMYVQHVLE